MFDGYDSGENDIHFNKNAKGIFKTPFCLDQDTSPEAGFPHLTYKPSSLTTINLGVGYFVSKYTENDIILISNFGTAALNVQTGGSTVVLNPYQSGFFVKRDDGDWNEINPA